MNNEERGNGRDIHIVSDFMVKDTKSIIKMTIYQVVKDSKDLKQIISLQKTYSKFLIFLVSWGGISSGGNGWSGVRLAVMGMEGLGWD